ncbi:MAG: hypothetical protein GX643_18450 [Acidimicrobiales bacterium]|nr:hypothetical protein [Acidimicrobiales bacterium]
MTNPTDLHDHDLERGLRDLLREKANGISGPAPAPAAAPSRRFEPPAGTAAVRPRRWVAAGAAAAALAVGGAALVLGGLDAPTDQVVTGSDAQGFQLDPHPGEPFTFDGFGSSDEAVRTLLEDALGPDAAATASLEEAFQFDHESDVVVRHLWVTFPGADRSAAMTLRRGGEWSLSSSSRDLGASRPVMIEAGGEVELLFAHPDQAHRAVVWYVDGDGQTLEAEIDRAMMEAGRRDVRQEVASVYESEGFTREAGLRFSEGRDLSGIERARVAVPGSVDLDAPVVVAYFDADDDPLAVWTDPSA